MSCPTPAPSGYEKASARGVVRGRSSIRRSPVERRICVAAGGPHRSLRPSIGVALANGRAVGSGQAGWGTNRPGSGTATSRAFEEEWRELMKPESPLGYAELFGRMPTTCIQGGSGKGLCSMVIPRRRMTPAEARLAYSVVASRRCRRSSSKA